MFPIVPFSFDLSREVVAVSLSLFDRYFATLGNHCNGNMALLASLTTLHIAIKLHDSKKIKLCTLANLSRGQFTSKDIERMEWTILSALQWKLHPPTPYAFVEHLLLFLPQEVNVSIRKGLNEVSKYLTELAVCDAYFVDCSHSSTIAFAAILNVMEDMNYSKFSGGLRESFLTSLAYHVNLHHRSADVVDTRQRLRRMLAVSSTVYSGNTSTSNVNVVTPNQAPPTSSGFENFYGGSSNSCGGALSIADRSMSSVGSVLSSYHNTVLKTSRSRASSIDTSKSGSCRFAQSPRRSFFASVSPLTSRAAMSTSLIEAGVQ
jgi:Cyclin, N-terminal domain/Cyclin, C-terminal domain